MKGPALVLAALGAVVSGCGYGVAITTPAPSVVETPSAATSSPAMTATPAAATAVPVAPSPVVAAVTVAPTVRATLPPTLRPTNPPTPIPTVVRTVAPPVVTLVPLPTPTPIVVVTAAPAAGVTLLVLDGRASLIAGDGAYLGIVSSNRFGSDSICNRFGKYGSQFSSTSVRNPFGRYGSPYSSHSAYNAYTSTPPAIILDGRVVGYLTKNRVKSGAVDPDILFATYGCTST